MNEVWLQMMSPLISGILWRLFCTAGGRLHLYLYLSYLSFFKVESTCNMKWQQTVQTQLKQKLIFYEHSWSWCSWCYFVPITGLHLFYPPPTNPRMPNHCLSGLDPAPLSSRHAARNVLCRTMQPVQSLNVRKYMFGWLYVVCAKENGNMKWRSPGLGRHCMEKSVSSLEMLANSYPRQHCNLAKLLIWLGWGHDIVLTLPLILKKERL